MEDVERRTQRWLVNQQADTPTGSELQLCKLLLELMTTDAVENLEQPLAADVLCCDLAQKRAVRGSVAAVRLLHGVLVDSFAKRQVQITNVTHQDEHTFTQFLFSGVQNRRLLGIPATQRRVLLAASITSTVACGRIVRIVLDYDVKDLLQQLGMTK